MKISEFIEILEELRATHGDLPVYGSERIWDDEIWPIDIMYYKCGDGEEIIYV